MINNIALSFQCQLVHMISLSHHRLKSYTSRLARGKRIVITQIFFKSASFFSVNLENVKFCHLWYFHNPLHCTIHNSVSRHYRKFDTDISGNCFQSMVSRHDFAAIVIDRFLFHLCRIHRYLQYYIYAYKHSQWY